ncbi:hypothetical protein OG239_09045 [Streptomyces sp. NBC_00868]|uniref:hypothetical protein n=1 Tax=unclassified Streptomyces TaxID=2593676 RepID=UPI00324FA602|nr:hypothetical protein OG239_09045 [Streptomyces sp. NBC_00868]
MSQDDRPTPDPQSASTGAQVQASARGWHTVQLAVFGFIGICGVLKSGGSSPAPAGIEEVAGILVLAALAVAILATYLVARVAWPVPGSAADVGTSPEGKNGVDRAARRLRWGLVLTFLAVVLVATASASSWWPTRSAAEGAKSAEGQFVQVETLAGTVCGTLGSGGGGSVHLKAEGQSVDIPLSRIASLSPASACP